MSYNPDWNSDWDRYPGRSRVPAFTVDWNGITYVLADTLQDKLADYEINIGANFLSFYHESTDQVRVFDPEKDVDLFGDITVDITSEQQVRNTGYEEPIFDSDGRYIVPIYMIVYLVQGKGLDGAKKLGR